MTIEHDELKHDREQSRLEADFAAFGERAKGDLVDELMDRLHTGRKNIFDALSDMLIDDPYELARLCWFHRASENDLRIRQLLSDWLDDQGADVLDARVAEMVREEEES